MASAIAALNDFGQSPWYDNLARTLLTGGGLQQLIDEDGIKGVTSNPTIFDKAMAAGEGYDAQLKECAEQGLSIEDSYWALVVQDVGNAADLLRPVYDATSGADGFVSLEVSPDLANDTAGTIAQARELFGRLGRPNVMIKIPATLEGLPAIEANIGAGINTNVTLIFSLDRHAAAVHVDVPAFVRALRVDRDHDALRAEHVGQLLDQLGAAQRGGVDRDLVGAGVEHGLRVLDRADAAADREWDEHVVRGATGQVDDGVAALVRGGDVEEDQLVGALRVVGERGLDGVARVAQVHEPDALDHAPVLHVEARDDALGEHGQLRHRRAASGATASRAARRSMAPV